MTVAGKYFFNQQLVNNWNENNVCVPHTSDIEFRTIGTIINHVKKFKCRRLVAGSCRLYSRAGEGKAGSASFCA